MVKTFHTGMFFTYNSTFPVSYSLRFIVMLAWFFWYSPCDVYCLGLQVFQESARTLEYLQSSDNPLQSSVVSTSFLCSFFANWIWVAGIIGHLAGLFLPFSSCFLFSTVVSCWGGLSLTFAVPVCFCSCLYWVECRAAYNHTVVNFSPTAMLSLVTFWRGRGTFLLIVWLPVCAVDVLSGCGCREPDGCHCSRNEGCPFKVHGEYSMYCL